MTMVPPMKMNRAKKIIGRMILMPIIAARIQPFTFSTLCSMVLLIQSPTPIPENMRAVTTTMFRMTGNSKYLTR